MASFYLAFPAWRSSFGGPAVLDQSLSFGALTRSGAGGVAPINNGGTTTSASIDSGDPSGHWQIATDGTITPTVTGEGSLSGSYSLDCTFTNASGSDTAKITVDTSGTDAAGNNLADTYSFASEAEINAILALGVGTISGKTAAGRGVVINVAAILDISDVYTAIFTLTSHDTADKVTFRGENTLINIGATKFTLRGIRTEQLSTTFNGKNIRVKGADQLIIEDCLIEGQEFDHTITYDTPPMQASAIKMETANSTNVTIRNNHIRWFSFGIVGLGQVITGNFIESMGADAIRPPLQDSNVIEVKYNCIRRSVAFGDGQHRDAIQFPGGTNTKQNTEIYGNIIWMGGSPTSSQGIFQGETPEITVNHTHDIRGNIIITNIANGIVMERSDNSKAWLNLVLSAEDIFDPNITLGNIAGTGNEKKFNAIAGNATVDDTKVQNADHATAFVMTNVPDPTNLKDLGNEADIKVARDAVLAALGIKGNGPLDKDSDGSASAGDHGVTTDYVNYPTTVPGSDGSLNAAFEPV